MKSIKVKFLSIIFFLLLFTLVKIPLFAWQIDNGVAICTAVNAQLLPTIVSDGEGGAIITWYDYRGTTGNPGQGSDIYAQRVDSTGNAVWTANGVVICTSANGQDTPIITSDGSEGAIITWEDLRNGVYNVYAQRVNSAGSTLWTLNGVAVCTTPSYIFYPTITNDGSGGAIFTWEDDRNSNYDIYGQRVNSTGSTLWTTNGVAICTVANTQRIPMLVSDGSGGAIITWEDYRGGSANDIYAQRVGSTGSTLWTDNGVAICTATSYQYNPMLVSDGSGGAIITWWDERNNFENIYAQRVDSNGSTLWTDNGVGVCTLGGVQQNPTLVNDGAAGAIITWVDTRNGLTDIYAQRVDSTGSTLWTANGVAICSAANYQDSPTIVSDGAGGAIITWYDLRNGLDYDIYAQRVDSTGSTLWIANGVAVCTASYNQEFPTIATDGGGGAIITWEDLRNGVDYDIYAQQINSEGFVPVNDWWKY